MKKLHILALAAILSTSSIGCGLFGGGDGPDGPSVTSVFPEEGKSGSEVVLSLENFNEKRDIVLFGGVPVKITDPSALLTGSSPKKIDERADKEASRETPALEIISAVKTFSGTVRVPKLGAGAVEITVRRGDFESSPEIFTILSADSASTNPDTDGDSNDDVLPPDDTAGVPPPADPANDPANLPPVAPPALASLTEGYFNASYNYLNLNWSVSYVDSAFIRIPVNYWYADVISFGQYHGSSYGPFPFGKAADEGGLLEKLSSSLLDDDFGSMPFNYCAVPAQGRTYLSHINCYTANPNHTSYNYVDVMIPLSAGKNDKSGVWKIKLPAAFNTFTLYYRDWSKTVHKKEILVANPNLVGC